MFDIRHARPQDIFSVITLAFETLPERYNPMIFNQFYESFPEGFFIAERSHTIIGFLIGIKPSPGHARILMLSVDHHNRRHGTGTALLNSFLKEMKEHSIKQIDLEVRTSNTVAILFYQKQGFMIQETIRGFYQNGEDAYQMARTL